MKLHTVFIGFLCTLGYEYLLRVHCGGAKRIGKRIFFKE